jgi:CysZ protein
MFASARKAFAMIFDRAFAGVVLRSLILTLILFALLFFGLQYGLQHLPTLHWHWVNVMLEWLASFLLIVVFVFLGAPVAALFGSLFLDSVAQRVEKKYYPADAPASGAPVFGSLVMGLRLTGWVIVVSLALLPVDIALPGVGSLATVAADGWLLGREYFELVALRHMSRGAANSMRKRHGAVIYGAGFLIALLAAIPVINFIAPFFGAAFMVHVFKRLSHEERPA